MQLYPLLWWFNQRVSQIINACLLTSAWSAASSDLYTSSRALCEHLNIDHRHLCCSSVLIQMDWLLLETPPKFSSRPPRKVYPTPPSFYVHRSPSFLIWVSTLGPGKSLAGLPIWPLWQGWWHGLVSVSPTYVSTKEWRRRVMIEANSLLRLNSTLTLRGTRWDFVY